MKIDLGRIARFTVVVSGISFFIWAVKFHPLITFKILLAFAFIAFFGAILYRIWEIVE